MLLYTDGGQNALPGEQIHPPHHVPFYIPPPPGGCNLQSGRGDLRELQITALQQFQSLVVSKSVDRCHCAHQTSQIYHHPGPDSHHILDRRAAVD